MSDKFHCPECGEDFYLKCHGNTHPCILCGYPYARRQD